MSQAALFDAGPWIVANCPGGYVLKEETLRTVSSFTLMWNLFENTLCGSHADVSALDQVATTIAGANNGLPDDIRGALQFWSDRYLKNGQFNYLFKGLNFRKRDRRAHVEAVLSGSATDEHSQVLASLIIVYRLRNNLFHGLKEIGALNEQVQNLDVACRVLAIVLLLAGKLP